MKLIGPIIVGISLLLASAMYADTPPAPTTAPPVAIATVKAPLPVLPVLAPVATTPPAPAPEVHHHWRYIFLVAFAWLIGYWMGGWRARNKRRGRSLFL